MIYFDEISMKRIETMHPKLREQLRADYLQCNNEIVPKFKRLRITQALRTIKEQDDLYAQGRTKPGKKVTNARGGQSYHNYGLAFDIVILEDKDQNGTFETANFEVNALWRKVAEFFKSRGWEWGGDWKSFKDYPHFQKTFGKTTAELLKMVKETGGTYPNI